MPPRFLVVLLIRLILVGLRCCSAFDIGSLLTGHEKKVMRLSDNPWPWAGVTSWLHGMPPLHESHSPRSEHWSNSVAICAVMKDENITDILEWITYHEWLGVDHIFLTDNNTTDGAAQRELLQARFPRAFLTLRNELEPQGQLKVYAWCAEEQRAAFNWIAFIDVDEYIVLRDTTAGGFKPFLDRYKLKSGLCAHWIIAGPSGHETRPPEGGVLRSYQRCVPTPHPAIKTIVNTWYLSGVTPHPHNFRYRESVWPVNEQFDNVTLAWHARPRYRSVGGNNSICSKSMNESECFRVPTPRHRPQVAEKIAIFHYVTKSLEDYETKLVRGSGVPAFTRDHGFFEAQAAAEEDADVCREPAALFDKCCSRMNTAPREEPVGEFSFVPHIDRSSRHPASSESPVLAA